ncbi:hypothetical protein QE342_gp075 [Pseudomonas phage vB_PaeS_B8]|nr:hypothetical protein PJG4_152 [Pseudomonas phage JG004]YP_008857139.1 hypothetical protein X831_gp099 [Pseudomonas phage PAK_P2]YP_008859310.1 hypothetical protein PAK_P400099 [Pseudomonas phage PAK_P4]YP_009200088.1 hypothetical protein K8_152 [Pseudomonas phage K8]YP_009224840.1 hypothetical protein PaoP5_150 [Pseudomonas phage PaoP5]YP_009273906.1 hypothetical protein BH773_gp077 [Pseudomonas phage K5]YP_009287322.1 hypothetical protein BIZ94_gp026 [Pseudomonas phage vB_PaeM_MAG1]YP_00
MARSIKASDFDSAYQFEAAKRSERKESRKSRDNRKASRGRAFDFSSDM